MTSRPSEFQLTGGGRLKLYSTRELFELPAPEWLIDGIIPRGGVVGLYGPPGEGKSFVGLDMAVCVSAGIPWQGHDTYGGMAVYIAAEGGVGITKRVKALGLKYNLTADQIDVAWLTESISVVGDDSADDIDRLFKRIDDEIHDQPVLIIVDTLARCFEGNENETADMGRFVKGLDRMRLAYGATVMFIHHTNAGGTRERGNGSLRGAADTMIEISRDGETSNVTVSCDKQKDAVEFDPIELQFQIVPEVDSAVLVRATVVKSDIVFGWISLGPSTFAELKARAEEPDSGVSLATLKRKLKELQAEGRITRSDLGIYESTGA